MRKIILIGLFLSTMGHADSLEIIGGGVTYHIIDNGTSNLYANHISNDGRLIFTGLMGIGYNHYFGDNYASFRTFVGENSVANPIVGYMGSYGWAINKGLDIGIVVGGYFQDDIAYQQKGIVPFSLGGGHSALVPVVGAEINFKVMLSSDKFIKFNNIISPVITNHTISFGVNFDMNDKSHHEGLN